MKGKTLLLIVCGLVWLAILGYIYFGSLHDHKTQAEKMLNRFMIARLQDDLPGAEVFLTDRAKKEYSAPGLSLVGSTTSPHFVNYKILKTRTTLDRGDKFQATFIVRIFEDSSEDDASSYVDETLIIKSLEENLYRIDSVARGKYVNL